MNFLDINGNQGEGGGQILRTSLSVAMLQQQPVRIFNIRAGRKKPGLMRSHLTAVKASGRICNAQIEGAHLGSTEVRFRPGPICGGQYHFSIGTAGSTTLLCQTILPALLQAEESSKIVFEGGTHNGMSPSLTFLTESFLPLLHSLGVRYQVFPEKLGFYPAGGGRWQLQLHPCKALKTLNLTTKPHWIEYKAEAIVAKKLPSHIATREINTVKMNLIDLHFHTKESYVTSNGPGNTLHLSASNGDFCAMIETTGKRGLSAEAVAEHAADRFKKFVDSGVMIEEHLADQLLLYMALSKNGSFLTQKPSSHTHTNISVLEQLTDVKFEITHTGDVYTIAHKE